MASPVGSAIALTGIGQIDGLVQGAAWSFPGARTLTYSLSLNDSPSGGTWSAYPLIAQAVAQAFQAWAAVANVSFVEAGSGSVFTASTADIAVTLTGNELTQALGAIGLGVIPDPAFATLVENGAGYTRQQYPSPEGDVFYDNYSPVFANPLPNSVGFTAIVHEIGHALGLKHPHDDGGNSRPTFASLGLGGQETRAWTLMGYDAVGSGSGLHPITPMLLDIQAIQRIYGANLSYRTGNDVYGLSAQEGIRAIWDAGGVDTISAQTWAQGARINLAEGGFSYLGGEALAHIAIAYGVQIENATGGAGNDELLGNALDNVLTGGEGDDILDGAGGNDVLAGGPGSDRYRFGYGSGRDVARDFQDSGSTDRVDMASPLLAGNFTISRLGTDIVLRIGGTGDELTLENLEGNAVRNVDIAFTNGTHWDGAYLAANANDPPVVTASNASVIHHQSVAAADLFGITDADGTAAFQYQFWDGGADAASGYFTLGGIAQASKAEIPVASAGLANFRYVGGTGPGVERVWVSAFDGIDWSAWVAWDMTTVGSPPMVAASNRNLHSGQSVPATTLFGVSDADGDPIAQYRFWDEGTAQTSGYFSLDGQRQIEGGGFSVSAADLANLQWVAGSRNGAEVVWARADDGFGFGPWVAWTMTTGNALPMAIPSQVNRTLHPGQSVAASSLFSVSDPDGDAITQFRFWDEGTAQTSGYFSLNDQRQIEGAGFNVSAADLANLQWVAGSQNASEVLWVRADDGFGFGSWVSWTMTSANSLPLASASNGSTNRNQAVAASSLFSVSDADGDAITQYRFWDEGTAQSSGYFSLDGQRQVEGAGFTIAAANLANLQWVGGSVAGGEVVWVRAHDGTDFGDWIAWTMTTLNRTPGASASNAGIAWSRKVAASTLFSVSDPDNDPIVAYEFWDGGDAATSGYFAVNGMRQAAKASIPVDAANLGNVVFVGGGSPGTEMVWVRVSDGNAWSAWQSWFMTTTGSPPAASATSRRIHAGHTVAAMSLFSASDADGDDLLRYQFWDEGATASSGYFSIAGVRQPAGQAITVESSNLADVSYVGANVEGAETLWVRAHDGDGYGAWVPWLMTTGNLVPAAAAADKLVLLDHYWPAAQLFSVSDGDADAMTEYELWDGGAGATSGYFTMDGVRQTANQAIPIIAPLLSHVSYVAGTALGAELLWVRAYDGEQWSVWQSWNMETVAYLPAGAFGVSSMPAYFDGSLTGFPSGQQQPPIVTPIPATLADRHPIAAANLFSVTDAENDPITRYEFQAGSGSFRLAGVVPPAGVVSVTAAELAQLVYVAPSAPGSVVNVSIRAFDGTDWSVWANAPVTVVPNHAPGVAILRTSANRNEIVPFSALISATDAEGDPIEAIELYDARTASRSGHFSLNGVVLEAGQVLSVAGSNLGQAEYVAGSAPDTERLWIRAYDGYDWSLWQPWVMQTQNRPPQVASADASIQRNQAVAVSSLVSAADPDSDAITRYEVYDEGAAAGSGYFTLGGIAQPAQAQIGVDADALGQARYVGGALAATEKLWARAYDGASWSAWTSWMMTTG